MAYPILSGPYGLKPINEVGGLPYAGSTRMIPIQQGYTTNMYNGDVVQVGTAGNLIISSMSVPSTSQTTQTAVPATVGVFIGCEYSGPTGNVILGKNRYNGWLGATNGSAQISDAVAYVVDDPNTVFKSAVLAQPAAATNATSTTTIGYMSPAFVGTNVYYVAGNGGNTTNGNSLAGVCGNTAGASNGAGNVRISGGTGQTTGTPFRVVGLVQETAVVVSTTGTCAGTALTVASTTGVYPGMQVIIPGATAGAGAAGYNTYVTAVTSSTAITVSASITAATSGVVTFVGYPEVLVKWNYGFHGYTNAVSVA